MAQKKCPPCPECLPGWLAQFADLMSLLLVFFILLLSMATMDAKKIEEYILVMKGSMGFIDVDPDEKGKVDQQIQDQAAASEAQSASESQEASEEIAQAMKEYNEQNPNEQIQMEQGKNEFTLDIPSSVMFTEGQYEIVDQGAKNFIAKLARIIRTMPQSFSIEVIGHTDRTPYQSANIPRDGWDISSLRAISVVKELIKNKIDPEQLKVAAFAQYRPKSDDPADNRRVELRFFSENIQKDLVQEENFFDRLEKDEGDANGTR